MTKRTIDPWTLSADRARCRDVSVTERRSGPITRRPVCRGRPMAARISTRLRRALPMANRICRACGNRIGMRAVQAGGIEGIVAPRYMIDLTVDMKDRNAVMRPDAAALYKARGRERVPRQPVNQVSSSRRAEARLVYASVQDRADAGSHPDSVRVADDVPADLHGRAQVA